MPNLTELNLRSCQITDKGMESLAESFLVKRNLRKLDLRYVIIYLHINCLRLNLTSSSKNDATEHGLAKVVQNLAYNPHIEDVNLSEFGRVKGRFEGLSSALAKLFQLTISLKKVCNIIHSLINASHNLTSKLICNMYNY